MKRIDYFIFILFFACIHPKDNKEIPVNEPVIKDSVIRKILTDTIPVIQLKPVAELEKKFMDEGLVNIHLSDSSIKLDLKYSTPNNFVKEDMYGDLEDCYLQADVVVKLMIAQEELKKRKAGYSLIVFDCARPQSVQLLMWQKVPMKREDKKKYLSNPQKGSLHNYGAAVDISIVDENGNEVDMGTPYDDMSELAYPVMEQQMQMQGKLTKEQIANRKLLRAVMYKAGFFNIQTEWWHFNSCRREVAEKKYRMIK